MPETKNIEVCFSPALVNLYNFTEKNVVLIDILRATTAICTAFSYGVKEIIPVGSVADAKKCKDQGMIVAGEKDGVKLDFADFGNSPFNFMNNQVKNATIAYCTTNGTKAIQLVMNSKNLLIGSYLNFSAITEFLACSNYSTLLFCSGWKNRFNLEDTLYAGAIAESLLEKYKFKTECDSTHAAVDLWKNAKTDLLAYSMKYAHRHRLKNLKLDDVVDYCHTFDETKIIPCLSGNKIIPYAK